MRLFPLLFGTRIFTKKFLGLAALLSTVGLSVHFGVSKPRQNNSEVFHLIGSQPLLESNRGNPYEQRFNEAYLVKDFNRNLSFPSLAPALYEKHMHPSTKSQHIHEFNGSMKTYLESEPPSPQKNYTSPLIDRINKIAGLRRDYAALAEEEITYKSYLYNQQLRDFEKSHIVQDLMWSLIEESGEKKIVVRPNSIDIDFQLEKVPENLDEHSAQNKFPLDANKVRNFKIRLKAYNPNNELKTIFKSIPLIPYQEVELVIFIDRAEIRPFHTTFQIQGRHNAMK